jgi:hypothetical protein
MLQRHTTTYHYRKYLAQKQNKTAAQYHDKKIESLKVRLPLMFPL